MDIAEGKSMNLPLVNPFAVPYESWKTRMATQEEMIDACERTGQFIQFVNDELLAKIMTPFEAAKYIASVGADNGLGNHINLALDNDKNFACWRKTMPSKTPSELSYYQKKYPNYDFDRVNIEINMNGAILPEGQFLFHGGIWPNVEDVVTDRPLSTTFCPQVALRNAEHKGKAYEENQIDLIVLRVQNPRSKAFVYRRKGTNLGHENEVLFATGAKLRLRSKTLIRSDYLVVKWQHPDKHVPIYVLEVDIS